MCPKAALIMEHECTAERNVTDGILCPVTTVTDAISTVQDRFDFETNMQ